MCSPREALYIVNSLHYSTFHSPSAGLTHPTNQDEVRPWDSPSPPEHISFGRSISPRLAAHSFLHKLVRQGFSNQAAKYTELMMQQNIRIHRRTMEAIVQSLCARGTPLDPSQLLGKVKGRASFKPKINDIPSHLGHSGIAAAQSILACARRFGQKRTERMYENLIYSCIMQGEIIVASLLFVLLVKDWQKYKALKEAQARDQTQGTSDGTSDQHINPSDTVIRSYPTLHAQENITTSTVAIQQQNAKPPYPQLQLLTAITSEIRDAFRRDTDDPGGGEYLQASLQALANLASLADHDQLHFGSASSLITTLYNCPKTAHAVEVQLNGKEATVNAYTYFHRCLSRMVTSLKTRVQPFDTRSCNSLLDYSLRHRMAPRQASKKVLDHMTQRRILNTTTANILLHNGTRLRRLDISQAALDILRRTSDISHLLTDATDSSRLRRPDVEYPKALPKFTRGLKRLRRQEFEVPKELQSLSTFLSADVHSLVTYITHLTSTGRPEVVVELLFKILPELAGVDHPSWGIITPEERKTLLKQSKEECLRRAVQLGPRFFSVLINALAKAGKTGLAERVWILAQEAERASWNPQSASDVDPWTLPIHAYTAMIQCYAAEAGHVYRLADNSRNLTEEPTQSPLKPYVHGWARFIYQKKQISANPAFRRSAGRKMAVWLFHSMLSGGHQVISSAFQTRNVDATVAARIKARAPVPDARFFNAILRLFRSPLRRHVKRGARGYNRTLRWALQRFAVRRTMSRQWSPLLQEVGRAMIATGYPIPLAYRPLFVGRLPEATRDQDAVVEPCLPPLVFPEVKQPFSPLRLPTTKTRGLPVRRRRTRRWVSKKCDS